MSKSSDDRELAAWIEAELSLYVKDLISDSDYVTLRKNLIDTAKAYSANVAARSGKLRRALANARWKPT